VSAQLDTLDDVTRAVHEHPGTRRAEGVCLGGRDRSRDSREHENSSDHSHRKSPWLSPIQNESEERSIAQIGQNVNVLRETKALNFPEKMGSF